MYKYDDNMMPMNMITPQNKIAGKLLAWARAKYMEKEDGSTGYMFPEKEDFDLKVNPQEMVELGVSDDDLIDCVFQVEDMTAPPIDFRTSYGLFPDQGYSNSGIVVRSRSNSAVVCIFKPTDQEDDRFDGYFEWFYDEKMGIEDLSMFLDRFDQATDNQGSNIVVSPMVPGYQEACEVSAGKMGESQREAFLRKVWHYHKTAPRGYKLRLEAELLPIWDEIKKGSLEESKPIRIPGFGSAVFVNGYEISKNRGGGKRGFQISVVSYPKKWEEYHKKGANFDVKSKEVHFAPSQKDAIEWASNQKPGKSVVPGYKTT